MTQLAELELHTVAAEYFDQLAELLAQVRADRVSEVVQLLLDAHARHRRVYVIGNGGSAATASHFVCDLSKTARVEGRPPLRAIALADNGALLTAWANDTAYERIFSEQIACLVEPGDVVLAISASGNSPNIVAGLKAAGERGARTVALVGFDGGVAAWIADVTVHVPCRDYGLVEDCHSAIGHAMTRAVRRAFNSELG
jgi:D-sedoheptulose 7-phosphate isomerase